MKRLLTFFLVLPFLIQAQTYKAIDTADLQQRKALKIFYEAKYKTFNEQLKNTYTGKKKKEITAFYKENQEDFLEEIDEKHFLYNAEIESYINSIVKNIVEKNGFNFMDYKVLVSKDVGPNAFCIGDGTIIINLGLFRFLENEDQMAAVLCHEIGHQVLDHTKKTILRTVERDLSSEYSKKTSSIKSQRYNRQSKAFEMLKDVMYKDAEQNRMQEMSADSIGYILYRNTQYAKNEFPNSLKILKEIEDHEDEAMKIMFLDSMDYEKFFNLPNQPFKKEWLKLEDFSSYNYDLYKEKIDEDSISTHPEIAKRIAKLNALFPELKELSENKTVEPNEAFSKIEKIADYESIPNLYYDEDCGASLYYALKKLKKYPDDAFAREWIGINFQKMYEAKKEYKFNRYVEQLAPKDQSKSYFQFLNFLWNLNLEEYKNIADYYTKK